MVNTVVGRQIWPFFNGAALSSLSIFLGWFAYLLLTTMMNSNLVGAEYWAEVRQRAISNPAITVALGLSCIGAIIGIVLMGRAVVGWRQSQTNP